MFQLSFFKKRRKICAITGHRELPLLFDGQKLEQTLEALIQSGVDIFYNGLAKGFDLLCAEKILQLKKIYPTIKLYGCVPYYGQEKGYCIADQKRYAEVLKGCDTVFMLSARYYRGCLHRRNDFMVEKADCLLAYCEKPTGGTAYTVKKFLKKEGVDESDVILIK